MEFQHLLADSILILHISFRISSPSSYNLFIFYSKTAVSPQVFQFIFKCIVKSVSNRPKGVGIPYISMESKEIPYVSMDRKEIPYVSMESKEIPYVSPIYIQVYMYVYYHVSIIMIVFGYIIFVFI
jgi:hypothetical protein